MTDSYYEVIDDADPLGEKFCATDLVRSTWSAALQHAAPVSALLVRALERCAARDDTRLSRVAVDLLGPVPADGDLWVRSRVERPGKQIELLSAEMLALRPDGQPRPTARASGWRLQQLDTTELVHAAAPLPRPLSEARSRNLAKDWDRNLIIIRHGCRYRFRPLLNRRADRSQTVTANVDHEVVIIGAGFGGIGAGVELTRAGIDDFLIVDKNDGIGGTWWANTYPGVAVDIPSIYYSFSYEPPKKWTRLFAPGAEVQQYAEQVVDSFGLRSRIMLNTTVNGARWDEDQHVWRVQLQSGQTLVTRFMIGAAGGLEIPQLPDISGIDDFAGKTVHTARWDHDFDYTGKRVAVIGTGATALQLIPELADIVERLAVFQRTPIWVAPKPDFAIPSLLNGALLHLPILRRVIRAAVTVGIDFGISGIGVFHDRAPFLANTLKSVGAVGYRRWLPGHPELAQQLTPDYAFGCKRPSVSNRYLKTFTRPNVELVTDPIQKITERGVITDDGTVREVDVLVCATGFKVLAKGYTPPFPLHGVDGLDLNTFWDEDRFQAYQGVSLPKFPNSFLITGPYGFAAGSYIAMIECTSRHAARAIAEARRRDATRVEVKQWAHDAYYDKYRRRGEKTLWLSTACEGSNTYYVNYHGDAATIRPSTHLEMWWGNKHFPLDHYAYTHLLPDPDCDDERQPATTRSAD